MKRCRALGRLEESRRCLQTSRSDERFGLRQPLRWVTGEEAVDRYWRGDWEAALALVSEFIAEVEARIAITRSGRQVGACQHPARSRNAPGADEDSARAVELAREQKDLQVLAPALALRAFVLVSLGRTAEASDLVDEVLALAQPVRIVHRSRVGADGSRPRRRLQ